MQDNSIKLWRIRMPQPKNIVLKKIEYQMLKNLNFTPTDEDRVKMAQSVLNANIDEGDVIIDSEMPATLFGATLDWSVGGVDDTTVGISLAGITVEQDLASDLNIEPTPAPTAITRAQLDTMIANGDDVTGVDTSEITDMSSLFEYNITFNQDISGWDTSSVTNMYKMFFHAENFNSSIVGWNTSNVENMQSMFEYAVMFNQDISGWNTSKVTIMADMFKTALVFNQDISSWDVSQVTGTYRMFQDARAFDQDLSAWDISSLTAANDMFKVIAGSDGLLSTTNYDALLNGWSTLEGTETQIPTGITFSGGLSQYSAAGETARNLLTGTYGWTITDGGLYQEPM